ncbi:elongation of very long chain fatty acids protein [Nesidiocoris tenuis]|uniref:Elongation of very long chain fatty acids protein n=1 Tax=Nesidiocoris tenuis TaxID=355587 RepID=A0ABN7APX8_9HEMI|nr:elongation of very long chain fatty acids protein [Nesidiocoris tenuis]
MATSFMDMYKSYREFWDENLDPRNRHLLLMDGPEYFIMVLAAYMYFVSILGPKLMKDRPPFDLKWFMYGYNTVQVVLNLYIVYEAFTEIWIPGTINVICEGVTMSYDRLPLKTAWVVHLYFLIKLLDLSDTLIMVLRKKDRQASFLHKYHHMSVLVAAWIGAAVMPGGSNILLFGTINCSIHAVMYSYYTATIINPDLRYCKYKRHLTEVQLIQFVVAGVHAVIGYFHPTCTFPKWAFLVFIPQDIFMVCMFSDFYIKTYLKPRNKAKKVSAE